MEQVTKQEINSMIDQASKNLEEGTYDSRPYDEGVKDTLNWLFFDGNKPDLTPIV